jgi:hypothetical protein
MSETTVDDRERTGRIVLTAIAAIALVAGAAIGGLALAAAAGIWAGVWDFRTGFRLLGIANTWGDLVAWITVADAIMILVLAKAFRVAGGLRLAAVAFAGAAIAYLGYAVPESYRPPEGTPGIHDISTDTADPPEFVAVLPLRADAPNTVEYGGSEGMTPGQLADLTRAAYPDLVTRTFDEPAREVFERSLAAVEELGWDLVAAEPDQGRIEAVDTTFWFRFKDDIVIRIRETGDGTLVDARSVSRVGGGDAGTNARRLRRFYDLL